MNVDVPAAAGWVEAEGLDVKAKGQLEITASGSWNVDPTMTNRVPVGFTTPHWSKPFESVRTKYSFVPKPMTPDGSFLHKDGYGFRAATKRCAAPGMPYGGLLVRINGGKPIYVGSFHRLTIPAGARIEFAPNDDLDFDTRSDNTGSVSVTIRRI